ncbi:MAG: hypothetical protein JSS34_02510 [Proteobacteria bacterium]|nr:hypothetical protein [Pseudomonadota bacterium]
MQKTEDLKHMAYQELEQIEAKNYASKIKDFPIKRIFKRELAFCGKEVEVAFC